MKRVKILMCIAVLLLTVFAFMACAEVNPDYPELWFNKAGSQGPNIGNANLIDTEAEDFHDNYSRCEDPDCIYWHKVVKSSSNTPGGSPTEEQTTLEG